MLKALTKKFIAPAINTMKSVASTIDGMRATRRLTILALFPTIGMIHINPQELAKIRTRIQYKIESNRDCRETSEIYKAECDTNLQEELNNLPVFLKHTHFHNETFDKNIHLKKGETNQDISENSKIIA